jgi:hypothetical protein
MGPSWRGSPVHVGCVGGWVGESANMVGWKDGDSWACAAMPPDAGLELDKKELEMQCCH